MGKREYWTVKRQAAASVASRLGMVWGKMGAQTLYLSLQDFGYQWDRDQQTWLKEQPVTGREPRAMAEEVVEPQATGQRTEAHDALTPVRLSGGRYAWIQLPRHFDESDRAMLCAQVDLICTDDE